MQKLPLRPLALAIAALSTASVSPLARAASYDIGPFEATVRSNLSIGASWRTDDPSSRVVSPGNTMGTGRASSSTADDGNLNYHKGDRYSLLLRGLHDLDLNAGNWGFFTRVKYWYDYEIEEGNVRHGHAANGYAAGQPLKTSGFEDLAQGKGFVFLDYYAYANVNLGDVPVELRAGNMVLNWGENTFIQGGVNVISPFDVTALRRPGSEIREALLPVGMVYTNAGLTDNLSVEAFYQYDWQRTILDECGTFWSSADPYGGGCNYLTGTAGIPDAFQAGTPFEIGRNADIEADDGGQWGVAARYFVDALNATEFGLYYVNYHSRTPIFSGVNTLQGFGQPINNPVVDPRFLFEFPEDIEVWAATFATNIGFWAWSGEVSYRPDFPLQINTTDLLQPLALGAVAEWSPMYQRVLGAGPGGYVAGFDNVSYTQAQTTFLRFFEQVLGADRLTFIAEIGAIWLDDMDDSINYGRSPAYGAGGFETFRSQVIPGGPPISCTNHPVPGVVPNPNPAYCNNDGFTEDFSWGYRISAEMQFNSALAGINLTPNIAWSHDVSGYSPAPTFVEDRKAISVGLRADYLNVYQAELSYTSFFGADYNEQQDRDFVSLSFSVAF
jgi:hypothetical protein